MNRMYTRSRSVSVLGVVLLAMVGAAQAAPCSLDTIELLLPDDEDSKSWSADYSPDFLMQNFGVGAGGARPAESPDVVTVECARVSGSGALGLEIRLEGPADQPELIELLVNSVRGNPYREVLTSNPVLPYEVRLAFNTDFFERVITSKSGSKLHLGPYELTITLKRLKDTCAMSAEVTGDVNGYYFGDVAWFLANEKGVVMDPELAGALGDLGDLAGGVIDSAHELGYEVPAPPSPSADELSFEEFVARELKKEQAKGPAVWGSQFVLGLRDMKRQQGDLAALSAISGFSLGLGATPTKAARDAHQTRMHAQAHAVTVTLGILAADQVPFELAPGQTSLIDVYFLNDDFIVGSLDVNLATKGAYTIPGIADGRQLKVHVKAKFAAMRGQATCARPW